MNYLHKAVLTGLLSLSLSPLASAVALDGTLTITAGDGTYSADDDAYLNYVGGSYFSMDGVQAIGSTPKPTWRPLEPGSAGGMVLGTYQNFVTNPDVPHPAGWQGDTNGDGIAEGAAGAGYNKKIAANGSMLLPFDFFGNPTSVGTNPVGYQSGENHPAPTADISDCVGNTCTLTLNLESWEVFWNSNTFEQGPRPDNTGPFTLAVGTYDLSDQSYSVTWTSQIKGGPFNGITGYWHLEGTHIAAVPEPATYGMMGAGLALVGWMVRRRKISN